MAYATVDDVQKTLGYALTEQAEIDRVNAWIADAETVIRVRLRLASLDQLDADALRLVIKESVARRVLNPEGKTTERIDDYSYTLASEAAKAGLYITDDEWALLAPTGEGGLYPQPVQPDWWLAGGRPGPWHPIGGMA